jgi:gliding motility-associated-like protein
MLCGEPVAKSTVIEVRPEYQNARPTISSNLAGKTIDVLFGTTYTDTIFGTDPDLDFIALAATGADFSLADVGMQFTPGAGNGKAKSVFTWQPNCSAAHNKEYKVTFSVTETACKPFAPEEISVTFNIVREMPAEFIPANIFTPNNDGLNDFFVMPTLPPDFCTSSFASITIYNRWGGIVYQSKSRDFAWDGKNVADGVYFYHLNYSDKEYKGTVTLIR